MPNGLAPPQIVSVSSHRLEHINCVVAPSLEEGGLYLGDIISTIKPSLLQQHRIEAILSCMHEHQIKAQCSRHLVLPLHDNLQFRISPYFSEAIAFIETARKDKMNVLVHCHAGLSRSPAIVCAYLMKKNKWTYADAIQFVQRSRQRIRINEGFAAQLIQYQQQQTMKTPTRKLTHERKDAQTSFSNVKVEGPLMFSDKEASTSIKLRRESVIKRMNRISFNTKEEHRRENLKNTTSSVLENNSTIVNQSAPFFTESDRLTPNGKNSLLGMISSPIELQSRQPAPLRWQPEEHTKMQTSYVDLSRPRGKNNFQQYERQPSIQPNLEIASRQIRFGQVIKPLVATMPSRFSICQPKNPRSNMG